MPLQNGDVSKNSRLFLLISQLSQSKVVVVQVNVISFHLLASQKWWLVD
jgi:hypothetical protein